MKRIKNLWDEAWSFAPVVAAVVVLVAASALWRKHQDGVEAAFNAASRPLRPARPDEYRGPTAPEAARILSGPGVDSGVEEVE